jgi:protein-disulfide isomerase
MSPRQRPADRARQAAAARRRRQWLWTTVAALLGGLILIGAVVLLNRPASTPNPSASFTLPGLSVPSAGYALGQADAPVTVELWEDFQCPACKAWDDANFEALIGGPVSEGKVRLVFVNLPFIGPESLAAAQAGYAAAAQNRFWPYFLALYARQGAENSGVFSTATLRQLAQGAGLDLGRFDQDRQGTAAADQISADQARGAALGLDSTPSFTVNGRVLIDRSYQGLLNAIDATLAASTP